MGYSFCPSGFRVGLFFCFFCFFFIYVFIYLFIINQTKPQLQTKNKNNRIEKLITCTEVNNNSDNTAFEDILLEEKVKKFKWAVLFAETLLEIQNFSR